jgi:hypothetical protein
VAATGSVGLDGFVTPHLSLGAEIGLLAGVNFGSTADDGDVESKNDGTILSATTALFATVWL